MPDEPKVPQNPEPSPLDQLKQLMREVLQGEFLPIIRGMMKEESDAKFAEIQTWVRTNSGASPDQIVGMVMNKVVPQLNGELQKMGDTLASKLQGASRPVIDQSSNSPVQVQQQPSTGGDKAMTIAVGIEHLLDTLLTKGLPAWQTLMQMKNQSSMNVQWAANLRQSDPIQAIVLASVLNPDPLQNQMPLLLANATQQASLAGLQAGLRTKISAAQAFPSPAPIGGSPSQTPTSPTSSAYGTSQPMSGESLPGSSGNTSMMNKGSSRTTSQPRLTAAGVGL